MSETILKVAMVIISVALIILCLLQSGKSDDIVNALTGQSSSLFAEQKERGVDLVMSRMTIYDFEYCLLRDRNSTTYELMNNRTQGVLFFLEVRR